MMKRSLRKHPTFCNPTTGFSGQWGVMTCHFPDLDIASDWEKQISHVAWTIRSTTQFWVVTCQQYGIYSTVPQVTLCRETSGGIVECQLFFEGSEKLPLIRHLIWVNDVTKLDSNRQWSTSKVIRGASKSLCHILHIKINVKAFDEYLSLLSKELCSIFKAK